jgi:hypothetical protein
MRASKLLVSAASRSSGARSKKSWSRAAAAGRSGEPSRIASYLGLNFENRELFLALKRRLSRSFSTHFGSSLNE